jgi:hypothetical protein
VWAPALAGVDAHVLSPRQGEDELFSCDPGGGTRNALTPGYSLSRFQREDPPARAGNILRLLGACSHLFCTAKLLALQPGNCLHESMFSMAEAVE